MGGITDAIRSSHALKNQHRKKPESSDQRPFEDGQAVALEPGLAGTSIERERHHGTQQQQQNEPAKQQLGIVMTS